MRSGKTVEGEIQGRLIGIQERYEERRGGGGWTIFYAHGKHNTAHGKGPSPGRNPSIRGF